SPLAMRDGGANDPQRPAGKGGDSHGATHTGNGFVSAFGSAWRVGVFDWRPPDGWSSARAREKNRGQSASTRKQPLSPPACPQPRRLVSLGDGGFCQGQERGQAGLPVDRLQLVPLVSRHGARVLREWGRRQAAQ